jgi:hypothetical protein
MKIDKAIGCLNKRKLTTVVDFDNKSNNAFLHLSSLLFCFLAIESSQKQFQGNETVQKLDRPHQVIQSFP